MSFQVGDRVVYAFYGRPLLRGKPGLVVSIVPSGPCSDGAPATLRWVWVIWEGLNGATAHEAFSLMLIPQEEP
jgi:hypothetical protein